MTITKKPRATETVPAIPEAEIAALIEKGGSVASKREKNLVKPQFIQLRLDRDLLASIDAALHKRRVKIPRHTWILEALYEKLEREAGQSI